MKEGHIWEKSYPPGISWRNPLAPAVTVETFLERSASQWPSELCIEFYGFKATFAQVRDLAHRAAKGFQALGVHPDVQVALHLPNTPHFVICFFGILLAGGRVVNISLQAAPDEINRQLMDCEASGIVTLDSPGSPALYRPRGGGQLTTLVICSLTDFATTSPVPGSGGEIIRLDDFDGHRITFAELIANDGAFEHHPRGRPEAEIAVLQYTGGTTGEQKGAMLTHANFSAVVEICARWDGIETLGTRSSDKTLVVLPLSHIAGLSCTMLLSVATGRAMILRTTFDVDRLLDDIVQLEISIFAGVPVMYAMLVDHPRTRASNFASLRICTSGGAPLEPRVLQRFRQLTKLTPLEGYGLTEAAPVVTCQPLRGDARPGTVGLPEPQTIVEVLDLETGTNAVQTGELGEICVKGPQVMLGYWKRPDATADVLRGSRLHTGDIGFIDTDGYLTLVDRKKDIILVGGHNVYPRVVEGAIRLHSGVAEVAVLGIPDMHLGEVPKAFVVPAAGAAHHLVEELRSLLQNKLARHEMPVVFELRADLPKTSLGKLVRRDLAGSQHSAKHSDFASPLGGRIGASCDLEQRLAEIWANRSALPPPNGSLPESDHSYVAARTPTEEALSRMWCEMFGLKQVSVKDNFFELGGHSLMVVRLIDKVNRTLHGGLGISELFQNPTVAQMASVIDGKQSNTKRHPAVVQLQEGSAELPVYFICTGDPNAVRLAQMIGGEHRIFGIEVPWPSAWFHAAAHNETSAMPTVEQIAARYAAALGSHAGSSPCVLVGHSFAGLVAFEVAHQLHNQGGNVEMVILLDTYIVYPSWYQKTLYRLRKQALNRLTDSQSIGSRLAGLWLIIRWMLIGETKRLSRLLKRVGQSAGSVVLRRQMDESKEPTDVLDEQGVPSHWRLIRQLYAKAMRTYRPRRVGCRGILFRADPDDEDFARGVDDSLGWGNLFSESLETIPVAADHNAMIGQAPHNLALAREIDRVLNHHYKETPKGALVEIDPTSVAVTPIGTQPECTS
jgi:long-chain acyl-CoA synthetase